jgi:hypothetical protein
VQNWVENFKKKENRPPSVEDRIPIAALYSSSREINEGEKKNRHHHNLSMIDASNNNSIRFSYNTSLNEQINRINIEDYKKMNHISANKIEPPIVGRFPKHEKLKRLRNESLSKVQKIQNIARNSISNYMGNVTLDIFKSSRSVSPRKAHLNKLKEKNTPNVSAQVYDENESRLSNGFKKILLFFRLFIIQFKN